MKVGCVSLLKFSLNGKANNLMGKGTHTKTPIKLFLEPIVYQPATSCVQKGGSAASQFRLTTCEGSIGKGWYLFRFTKLYGKVYKAAHLQLFSDHGDGLPTEQFHRNTITVDKEFTAFIHFDKEVKELRLYSLGEPIEARAIEVDLISLALTDQYKQELVRFWRKQKGRLISELLDAKHRIKEVVPKQVIDPLYFAIGKPLQYAMSASERRNYRMWISQFNQLSDNDRHGIRRHINEFRNAPLISVLMPVYNPPAHLLEKAIESVRNQLYTNWEFCIADDCSSDPDVRTLLSDYQKLDSRIKVVFRSENGHISEASNSALELVQGEYIALLDHDDELAEDALYQIAWKLEQHPEARLIYSDEDKIDESGNRFDPFFKPSFSPDLLRSQNYISHLGVYHTKSVREIGGFRKGLEGSQDYDLVLRFTENVSKGKVQHIPRILYHWRVTEGSVSTGNAAKPYAAPAAKRAITEHLQRTGIDGVVEPAPGIPVYFRVRRNPCANQARVTVVISTHDGDKFLQACLQSVLDKTRHPNYEVVIADEETRLRNIFSHMDRFLDDSRVRFIFTQKPLDTPLSNNYIAQRSEGEILVFLSGNTEIISEEWLEELVSHAQRQEVGAVGARLLSAKGNIQHAGMTLGLAGLVNNTFYNLSQNDLRQHGHANLIRNVSAVSGVCLATRREVFDQVSGFDGETFATTYSDVDYCLRLIELGYLIVYTPYSEMLFHESKRHGNDLRGSSFESFLREQDNLSRKWKEYIYDDPFYNPNLTLNNTNFSLSWPPRVEKPWKC